MCKRPRTLGEGVRGQAASGSRAQGSCEAHVEKGRAGVRDGRTSAREDAGEDGEPPEGAVVGGSSPAANAPPPRRGQPEPWLLPYSWGLTGVLLLQHLEVTRLALTVTWAAHAIERWVSIPNPGVPTSTFGCIT